MSYWTYCERHNTRLSFFPLFGVKLQREITSKHVGDLWSTSFQHNGGILFPSGLWCACGDPSRGHHCTTTCSGTSSGQGRFHFLAIGEIKSSLATLIFQTRWVDALGKQPSSSVFVKERRDGTCGLATTSDQGGYRSKNMFFLLSRHA